MAETSESTGVRSYADVVTAHAPALLRLAIMLTGRQDEAEDLLQSALAKAGPHGKRIAGMAAPAAYLRRVLVNERNSWARRDARRAQTVELSDEVAAPATPDRSRDIDARDEAWRWLATLTPVQRAVLALRYYEDLPDSEIASILDCPESTVRSHARRGLAALRERLSGPEEGDTP